MAGLGILFEVADEYPAVSVWHLKVHQDHVRALGQRQLAALLTIIGRENLEITDPLKARLEHVEVVVVVFDVEHFGHDQPLFRSGRHSITSSARASKDGGTARPSDLAVLRLITSSYLVGTCTGRSAGFAPRRIRST